MFNFFNLFVFSTPVIILQSLILWKFYCVNISTPFFDSFFVFIQALISSIFSTFLLGYSILEVLKNKKSTRNITKINKNNKLIKFAIFIILITTILLLIVSRKGLHDYSAYLYQWNLINEGFNPWINKTDDYFNAYLPIHNIFAPLASLNISIPKIIFLSTFLIAIYISATFNLNFKRELDNFSKLKLFILFAFNPFCLILTTLYGLNDTFVAGLMILSLYLSLLNKNKVHSFISGITLALATMVKIYPIFVAPLFIFRKRKIDITFFTSYFLSITLILLTSISIWGKSILDPILFASERLSKQLSFFKFSRVFFGINLDEYSIYAMCVVIVIIFIIIKKYKIDLLPGVVITLSMALSFYKVGHPQFFLFFFGVSPMLIRYIYDKNLTDIKTLFISYILWICFLNAYQTFDSLSCQMGKGLSAGLNYLAPLGYVFFVIIMLTEFIKLLNKMPNSLSSKN